MSFSLKDFLDNRYYVVLYSRQGDHFLDLIPKDYNVNTNNYQTSEGILNAAIFKLRFEAEIFLKDYLEWSLKKMVWTPEKIDVYSNAHYRIMTIEELFDNTRWNRESQVDAARRSLGKTLYDN